MQITINGLTKDLAVPEHKPLLWVIREEFSLTGTKYSCGAGLCGACSVEVDGVLIRSCSVPISYAFNKTVVTIENKKDVVTQAVQQAWIDKQVPQCGYCQSGQVMAASALLQETPHPSKTDVDKAMSNLCRCGTYPRIREGIERASEILQENANA